MFTLLPTTRPVPADRQVEFSVGTAPAIRLRAGGLVPVLGGGAGNRIDCIDGTIWVTQEGDAVDYVLGPGETFRAGQRGRVVVQALSDAVFEVS